MCQPKFNELIVLLKILKFSWSIVSTCTEKVTDLKSDALETLEKFEEKTNRKTVTYEAVSFNNTLLVT